MSAEVTLVYDDFLQLANPLPDYSSYGWCYKGWVVSSVIDDGLSLGEITPPAWINLNVNYVLLPSIDGGMLTTGKFTDLHQPDSANPYVDDANPARVPPFPGEDFLENLPGGVNQAVNLVPEGGVTKGTVFITLEPSNYVTDTTNFPLFVMTRDLPADRADVMSDRQVFIMNNRTNYNRDVYVGFPRVNVQIQRF